MSPSVIVPKVSVMVEEGVVAMVEAEVDVVLTIEEVSEIPT